jgi:hypothetical protein
MQDGGDQIDAKAMRWKLEGMGLIRCAGETPRREVRASP